MRNKKLNHSKNDLTGAEPLNTGQSGTEDIFDVPDFTPEQWEWLKAKTREYEKDFVPTRSLFPGL
jgi:hypothetical protein